jgi:aspartate aminotransferase-like enzyme
MGTRNKIAVMSGEAMVGLLGALRSCLGPGDRVLAVSSGIFGRGIGEMAAAAGAEVRWVEFGFDEVARVEQVEAAISEFSPKMLTAVHCETPSGTLTPVAALGALRQRRGVPLYYVDAVASVGGAPVRADDWGIDLCLAGTQKALSAPPDLGLVAVSDAAWEVIAGVGYQGYDALLPFRDALSRGWFPYTPSWGGLAALGQACALVLKEGLERVFDRHARAAARCRELAAQLGLELFPKDPATSSPTVTALRVPDPPGWRAVDQRLRRRGVALGGSLGELAGRVMRVGHMGSQADPGLVERGMAALGEALGR